MELATHGWTDENYAETGHERGLTLTEFLARMHQINSEGLPVRLSVESLRLYKPWQSRELLKIGVHTRPGFTHLSTMAKVVSHFHEGNGYHISLCFKSELGRGMEAYERILHRYNGRTGILSVQVANSAAALTPESPLSIELLTDPDIALLHNGGKYWNRPLHVSL